MESRMIIQRAQLLDFKSKLGGEWESEYSRVWKDKGRGQKWGREYFLPPLFYFKYFQIYFWTFS